MIVDDYYMLDAVVLELGDRLLSGAVPRKSNGQQASKLSRDIAIWVVIQ